MKKVEPHERLKEYINKKKLKKSECKRDRANAGKREKRNGHTCTCIRTQRYINMYSRHE